jgi:hypothetical protein
VGGNRAGSEEPRCLCDFTQTKRAVEEDEIGKLTRRLDDRLETCARERDAHARARELTIAHAADQIVSDGYQYVRDVFHDRLGKYGFSASVDERRFSYRTTVENARFRLGLGSSVAHRPPAAARTLPTRLLRQSP